MAIQDGYLWHVCSSYGLEIEIPGNFLRSEIGWVTDRLLFIIGDGSPNPARVATNKTTGSFSYTSLDELVLPSGLAVEKAKPGSVGAITPERMTAQVGMLCYSGLDPQGQDTWHEVAVVSDDGTLTVTNGTGALGNELDIRINFDSAALQTWLEGQIKANGPGVIVQGGLREDASGNFGLEIIKNLPANTQPLLPADSILVGRAADGAMVTDSFGTLSTTVLGNIVATQTFQQVVVNPILWVRPDGDDGNDGLVNSPSRAFKTPAAALAKGTNAYNFASSQLTIQLGIPGTYAAPANIPRGTGTINIVGDLNNQEQYILAGNPDPGTGVMQSAGIVTLSGLRIENGGTNSHCFAAGYGASIIMTSVTLECTQTTSGSHAFAPGGQILLSTGCVIRGSSASALYATAAGTVSVNTNANLSVQGTPTFSTSFAAFTNQARVQLFGGASVSGAANGRRYFGSAFSIGNTNGQGEYAFPGNQAGYLENSLYS